jgi:hypothetical protein
MVDMAHLVAGLFFGNATLVPDETTDESMKLFWFLEDESIHPVCVAIIAY